MPIVEPLKFDIRVRDRLLRKGLLSESEVNKYLEALPDAADKLVELDLKQPALQKESERAEYAPRISRPSPAIARPIRPFDEDDGDELAAAPPVDESDDLDDEDEGASPDASAEKKDVDDDWGTEP